MNANLSFNAGNIMPVLMNYTPSTRISEMEDKAPFYDDVRQIVEYDTRTVGTYSLKTEVTEKRPGVRVHDKKNAIDDSKSVK
jgi:hypothetical protein